MKLLGETCSNRPSNIYFDKCIQDLWVLLIIVVKKYYNGLILLQYHNICWKYYSGLVLLK